MKGDDDIKVEVAKYVGLMIKKYRKKRGLTQRELGEKVGLKHNTIATYESGRNSPEQYYLYKIARALHVTTDDLHPKHEYSPNNLEKALLDEDNLDMEGMEFVMSIIERLKSNDFEENMAFIDRLNFSIEYYDRFKKNKVNTTYNVSVESKKQYFPLYQASYNDENKAVDQANKWANEYNDKSVFVRYYQSNDDQSGYVNRDGYSDNGVSWTK